jgi:cytochrome P450
MTTIDDARIPVAMAASLIDPEAYADDRIHETYRWLRANNPIGRAELEGFDPFWVVTRHADILEVSRQNALFLSGARATTLTSRVADAQTRSAMNGSPHLVRSLIQMDAPDHLKYRLLTQKWFSPANVRELETSIRDKARATVDRMAAKGDRCDFVADVALGFPLHVIMDILGVPTEDEPRMLSLTQDIFGGGDPEKAAAAAQLPPEILAQIIAGILGDFSRYFSAISADRRANPRNDLATIIANAVIDGEPISELEASGYYTIIATAGHDTTSSSLAGGVGALARDPELLARLRADPALIPAFVDEAIRWTSPVKTFMRTAAEDTELAGRRIAKGDWLMLCYASGNRDEAVFEDPGHFRLDRTSGKHLAFGYGAHLCLGQHLAKLEMRVLLEELLPRLNCLELDGELTLSASWFVNGPKHLPIRYELAS